MEVDDARRLAVGLMTEHGLVGWRLVFDRARTRAGVCRPARREIGLSRVLTTLHSEASVRDTVLHEIAHALVGPEHGHDGVWRERALAIGCSGERCTSPDEARPEPPWVGTCPSGHEVGRYRRPSRLVSCARCRPGFDPAALLTWTYQGRSVPMGVAYDRQLAALRRRRSADGAAAQLSLLPRPAARRPAAELVVGDVARVLGGGRYGGQVGLVRTVGRTRYHLATRGGVLTVPFALAERVTTGPSARL